MKFEAVIVVGIIFGGIALYTVIGMFAYYLMTEKAKFRDTEGCAMLSLLWPGALAFWLCIGWPLIFIGWAYRKATKPRQRRSKPEEVK